jgi:hypothetical protein
MTIAYFIGFGISTVLYAFVILYIRKEMKADFDNELKKHLANQYVNFCKKEDGWIEKNAKLKEEIQNLRCSKLEFPKGGLPVKFYYTEKSFEGTVQKVVEERHKVESQIYTLIRNFEYKTKVRVLSVSCNHYNKDNPNAQYVFTESVEVITNNPFQA